MATSQALDDVVGPVLATLPDGTEYRHVLSTPSDGTTHVTPDGRTWVAVQEGVVEGQVVQTPSTLQWKGRVAPVADAATVLEQFIGLASGEIDLIATSVQYKPPADQAAIVEFLHGLSATAQKSQAAVREAVQSLPVKDREEMLSSLEKSGVVDIMNLLIPLYTSGDAWNDPGFSLHEASKTLYATANISSWWAGYFGSLNTFPTTALVLTSVASAAETAGLLTDIASQVKAQNASDTAQANIDSMELAVERMEQKINYIMDLPDGAPIPTTPPDTKPVSLTALEKMLEVTMKFFKFEGCFTPTFGKDKQLIRIGPLAASFPPIPLLVTGFVDLGGMQDNDVVTITTKVLEPPCAKATPPGSGGSYVIWRTKIFTGRQCSGLKSFEDIADLLEVPGDGVELLICQSASAHSFDSAFLLTIPYQFLVQSTVAPAFVLL